MSDDICRCQYTEAWENGEHQSGCPMDDLEDAYREARAEVAALQLRLAEGNIGPHGCALCESNRQYVERMRAEVAALREKYLAAIGELRKLDAENAEARALLARVRAAFSLKVPSETAEQDALGAVDAFLDPRRDDAGPSPCRTCGTWHESPSQWEVCQAARDEARRCTCDGCGPQCVICSSGCPEHDGGES